MKKTTGFEKLDPHKEEFPCDECGAVVKRWTLTYVGTRKLCKDCYDKIPFQCHGCDRVFNRKVTTLHIEKGRLYCDECYQRIFITYQDEERRRRTGYEKVEGSLDTYPCPECGRVINTWDLVSDKYGRKVCKDCHDKLLFTCHACDKPLYKDKNFRVEKGDFYCYECYQRIFTSRENEKNEEQNGNKN